MCPNHQTDEIKVIRKSWFMPLILFGLSLSLGVWAAFFWYAYSVQIFHVLNLMWLLCCWMIFCTFHVCIMSGWFSSCCVVLHLYYGAPPLRPVRDDPLQPGQQHLPGTLHGGVPHCHEGCGAGYLVHRPGQLLWEEGEVHLNSRWGGNRLAGLWFIINY